MAVCYDKLWKLLIDKRMKKIEYLSCFPVGWLYLIVGGIWDSIVIVTYSIN